MAAVRCATGVGVTRRWIEEGWNNTDYTDEEEKPQITQRKVFILN